MSIDKLIDPSVVRLLVTIAETGRFAAAAQTLGITQSSVSQRIRRIETIVGRRLFRRTRRGVALTEDGQAVIVYARAMLGLAADLRDRLDGPGEETEISVGMSEDFCRTALPSVLRLFVLGHRRVRVRIVSGPYDVLALALEQRTIDFAIMRRCDRFPDHEPLYEAELDWIGGLGMTLPIADPVPLVLAIAPNPSRETVMDTLRAAGRTFTIRFEGTGIAGIEMAIGANLGVCAGPRSIPLLGATPLPHGHGLPALPPVAFVMVRAAPVLSAIAQAFANVLADAARSHFALTGDARASVVRLMDPVAS